MGAFALFAFGLHIARKRTLRVLIVDDDRAFSSAMAKYLSSRGVLVEMASSAREARKLVESCLYDRIFCDFRLRATTGIKLCDSLEGEIRGRCVIVSGHSKEEIFQGAKPRYLTLEKPCTGRDLLRLSQTLCPLPR
jgi:DNA-binding NtrC family response regulator